jgi:LCP family protein required for cell wall assembly
MAKENKENIVMIKPRRFDQTRVWLSRTRRKFLSHVWFARATIVLTLFFTLLLLSVIINNIFFKSSFGYYYSLAKDFILAPEPKVETFDGRVNVLILGRGGGNHEAPDLTDTMILMSVNPRSKSMTMISLPRDIWITKLRAKLNSTYYWGNKKKPLTSTNGTTGGGLALTKSVVEEITGQTVQYGLVIDFEGFTQIIDILGGVKVDVENSFTDYKYPIVGRENDDCGGDPDLKCRYEIIHFDQGVQFMDGDTALKFARSRNALGVEGTDFAREARQEKVIEAIKNKIISKDVLLSPKKLLQIKNIALAHIEEDIGPSAAAVLTRYIFDARKNIKYYILDPGLLINPPKSPEYDNLYVLIPKDQDWSRVQEWVKERLK